jgi:hypothetical protein
MYGWGLVGVLPTRNTGLNRDLLSNLQVLNGGTDLCNNAGALVSEDDRGFEDEVCQFSRLVPDTYRSDGCESGIPPILPRCQ